MVTDQWAGLKMFIYLYCGGVLERHFYERLSPLHSGVCSDNGVQYSRLAMSLHWCLSASSPLNCAVLRSEAWCPQRRGRAGDISVVFSKSCMRIRLPESFLWARGQLQTAFQQLSWGRLSRAAELGAPVRKVCTSGGAGHCAAGRSRNSAWAGWVKSKCQKSLTLWGWPCYPARFKNQGQWGLLVDVAKALLLCQFPSLAKKLYNCSCNYTSRISCHRLIYPLC